MLSNTTFQFGEELTTALLGLDALYAAEQGKEARTTSSDIERLVVLNMSTTHEPDAFASYADARDCFVGLKSKSQTLPELDRRVYYGATCSSAINFATWRESGLDFSHQISEFLHVPAKPASDEELASLKSQMRAYLNELGYSGDLRAQCATWEARQRVEPDDVESVLNDMLSDAWDLTSQLLEIPAPKSDAMKVEIVRDVPYNAMCDFANRLIRLNVDPTLTRPGLRHLAVHEGYPGHYVQFRRREIGYAHGKSTADGLLSVVNTASSTTFEGIADMGMEMIGWHESLDDKLSAVMTRYRSGIGTRAAWALHAEKLDPSIVREQLLNDALVGGEGWVDGRMRFISAHDRAALIWSYWRGAPSVNAAWRHVAADSSLLPAYVEWIYDRMHSPSSIAMFNAS